MNKIDSIAVESNKEFEETEVTKYKGRDDAPAGGYRVDEQLSIKYAILVSAQDFTNATSWLKANYPNTITKQEELRLLMQTGVIKIIEGTLPHSIHNALPPGYTWTAKEENCQSEKRDLLKRAVDMGMDISAYHGALMDGELIRLSTPIKPPTDAVSKIDASQCNTGQSLFEGGGKEDNESSSSSGGEGSGGARTQASYEEDGEGTQASDKGGEGEGALLFGLECQYMFTLTRRGTSCLQTNIQPFHLKGDTLVKDVAQELKRQITEAHRFDFEGDKSDPVLLIPSSDDVDHGEDSYVIPGKDTPYFPRD